MTNFAEPFLAGDSAASVRDRMEAIANARLGPGAADDVQTWYDMRMLLNTGTPEAMRISNREKAFSFVPKLNNFHRKQENSPGRSRFNMDGVTPSLVLNFDKNLYSRADNGFLLNQNFGFVQDERATKGWGYDANGNIIEFPSGSPRRSFDVRSSRWGLLCESAATNLMPYAIISMANTTASGTASNSDLNLNALGMFPGLQIAGSTTSWNGRVSPAVAVTGGLPHAITFFYRFGTANRLRLAVRRQGAGGGQGAGFNYDGTNTNYFNNIVTGVISNIKHVLMPDGITRRVQFIYTPNEDDAVHLHMAPGTGVAGETVIVLGYQIEQNVAPTSFIPTTGVAVTRGADFPFVQVGSWYNFLGSTAYVDCVATGKNTNIALLALNENNPVGGVNRIEVFVAAASNSLQLRRTVNGESQGGSGNGGTFARNTRQVVAARFLSNDTRAALNGVIGPSPAVGVIPESGLNRLHLGRNGGTGGQINGHVYNVLFYPTTLADAQITQLSQLTRWP